MSEKKKKEGLRAAATMLTIGTLAAFGATKLQEHRNPYGEVKPVPVNTQSHNGIDSQVHISTAAEHAVEPSK